MPERCQSPEVAAVTKSTPYDALAAESAVGLGVLAGPEPVAAMAVDETVVQAQWQAYFHFGEEATWEGLSALIEKYFVPPLESADVRDVLRGIHNFLSPSSKSRQAFQSPQSASQEVSELLVTELRGQLHQDLSQFLDQDGIEEVLQYALYRISQQLKHSRSSWPAPLWRFEVDGQSYIVQAADAEMARMAIEQQYPTLVGQTLALAEVSGILAANQVVRVPTAAS